MNYINTDIDFPNKRIEYTGVGNPRFVSDILNSNESLLTALDAVFGLSSTGFAVISGLDHVGGPLSNFGAGLIFLNGKFLYLPSGCTYGAKLRNDEQDGIPKLFSDASTKNIYHLYYAKEATLPYVSTDSPALTNTVVDAARLNLSALKTFIQTYYYTKTDVDNFVGGISHLKLDIGYWDMTSGSNVPVAHGLSATERLTISSMKIMIINDSNIILKDLESYYFTGNTCNGIAYINTTYISLTATSGAYFDTTDYNSTSINRGYILIHYIKD